MLGLKSTHVNKKSLLFRSYALISLSTNMDFIMEIWEWDGPLNKIVDHSDVVGASPVGAAPTTSSFST